MSHLLPQRDLLAQDVGRQQPLEEVVVAAAALAPREPDHAGDGVRLEHGAHDVRRQPEPVGLRPAGALEVERRGGQPADPLEHQFGDLVLSAITRGAFRLEAAAEPRVLAGQDEGETLLYLLRDVAALEGRSDQPGS